MRRLVFLTSVLAFHTLGCSHSSSSDEGSGTVTPTTVGPPEAAYCATTSTFAGGITVTGQAQYIRREIFGSSSLGGGLGSASLADSTHPASVHPIRYAEVRVTNASGQPVQCAETLEDGTFTLQLPQDQQAYQISINSRSLNAHLFASVLNAPNLNQFYSLSTTVTANTNLDLGTLTAQADGDLLGGSFNILDQLLNANLYLVSQVGNCGAIFQLCESYDPTVHKVSVYWMKGFNPNDYFGPDRGGLSFYLPGYSRLFILGGLNGDTNSSDTDHFDNSVIIHEYGHFLEDNWLKTDSPGGAHDGDELLDPRLAWSEGWGDFIQAAVRGDPHYIDTLGNVDGVTDLAFYVDTETATLGADYPTARGEGNFREFAITRLLWDALDNTASETMFGFSDDISGKFAEIWAALSKSQFGYRDPVYAFRNVGLFLESQFFMQLHPQGSDAAASNWVNLAGLNQMNRDTSHYAQYLVPANGGDCASAPVAGAYYFQITPATVVGDDGSLQASDLFQNNRFYHLHVNSAQSGNHSLQLVYQDDDGIPVTADLDLYLYNSKARFAVSDDMVGFSRQQPSTGLLQTETVTAPLAAGNYLIDVNVFTGQQVGTKADYNLVLDGVVLCPGNLVPL